MGSILSPRKGLGSLDFKNTIAVVTGAGSGIGRATALRLAGSGSRIVCVDINLQSAKKTAEDVDGVAYEADTSNSDQMDALAAKIEDEVGPVGILVNNAGVGMTGRFLDVSLSDWLWIQNINLNGVLNGCRSFGPYMVKRKMGHVVNMSSGLGYFPRATESSYCTTKAGVLMFSRCLRADWHSENIGVSAICPGVINTNIINSTKFLGERNNNKELEATKKLFSKGHSADVVAKAVMNSIKFNRAVVPAGIEASIGWVLQGLMPLFLQDLATRSKFMGGV